MANGPERMGGAGGGSPEDAERRRYQGEYLQVSAYVAAGARAIESMVARTRRAEGGAPEALETSLAELIRVTGRDSVILNTSLRTHTPEGFAELERMKSRYIAAGGILMKYQHRSILTDEIAEELLQALREAQAD